MAAADRRREAPFGVSSEGSIALRELAIDSENRTLGFPYVPSPGLLVDTLLVQPRGDLGRFSFVDFGSGKGRVLLVASHYPFHGDQRVVHRPASLSAPARPDRRGRERATAPGSHFGDTPRSRTSGRSNSRSTSRASARRPIRSRR